MPRIEARVLLTSPTVSVVDSRCRNSITPTGPEQFANSAGHHLVLTRNGMFVQHVAGRRDPMVVDPGTVLFFNAGDPYRTPHPEGGIHECTVLLFSKESAAAIVAMSDPSAADRQDSPFPCSHGPVSPSLMFRYQALRTALRSGPAGVAAAEEEALGILQSAVLAGVREIRPQVPDWRTRRRHRDLAAAIRQRLARDPHNHHPLEELARSFQCSAFHLAHVFRREEGVPIHQYLVRLRLALALDQIADGAPNLSRLAVELGFSSHSHFTELFRQTYGVPPSAARARLSVRG